jgi:acetyl esterase/lipase
MQRLVNIILFVLLSASIYSQVNIWEGTTCKKNVILSPYITEGTDNVGVVVCPGGSYFWHDSDTEGHEVGRWLQSKGISAFVLNYRTAYVPAFLLHYRLLFRGNRYPDPQNDLLQALRYIRNHSTEYGVDPHKIGAMGFSAGGHLVMSSVELFSREDWPNFIVPVYPVVTMEEACVHKRSRRGLLGDSKTRNKHLRNLLSLEKHVPIDCPPVFLVNCKDDPIVDYRNSVLLDSALTSKGICHEYIQYKTGGHGFGVSDHKGSVESREWKNKFVEWLNILLK